MSRAFLSLFLVASVSAFAPCSCFDRSGTALGVAIDTSDIKNGLTIELDGEPYKVLSFSIMKQARGAAKTTIKFKNLIKGNTIENTYRSGEKFETALIEKNAHQYTYEDGVSPYPKKVVALVGHLTCSFYNGFAERIFLHGFAIFRRSCCRC